MIWKKLEISEKSKSSAVNNLVELVELLPPFGCFIQTKDASQHPKTVWTICNCLEDEFLFMTRGGGREVRIDIDTPLCRSKNHELRPMPPQTACFNSEAQWFILRSSCPGSCWLQKNVYMYRCVCVNVCVCLCVYAIAVKSFEHWAAFAGCFEN